MLKPYLQHYLKLTSDLAEIERLLKERAGATLSKKEAVGFIDVCELVRRDCQLIRLRSPLQQLQRTIDALGEGRLSVEGLSREFEQIRLRIQDELDGHLFLLVGDEQARYYAQPDLFGSEVSAKLPGAQADIEEAGTCFALGRPTACVLHLMRVLEVGVKAFAAHPKIAYQPGLKDTMGQIATALEKRANDLPSTTAAEKLEKEHLQGIAAHFRGVTGAWRNPHMHTTTSYTAEQARVLLEHVGTFLRALVELL